jgi:hypothetical protein
VGEGHCGLSFRLSYEPKDDEHREHWTSVDLRRLPLDSRVSEVLIVGCPR